MIKEIKENNSNADFMEKDRRRSSIASGSSSNSSSCSDYQESQTNLITSSSSSKSRRDPPYKDHSIISTNRPLTEKERNTLHLYNNNNALISGPFPLKLMIILKVIELRGQQNIITWLPHGRAFLIRRPLDFESRVLPEFFTNNIKLSSFKRQLNLYDIKRITKGPDTGAYYNEKFLRGMPLLVRSMKRRVIMKKGPGGTINSNVSSSNTSKKKNAAGNTTRRIQGEDHSDGEDVDHEVPLNFYTMPFVCVVTPPTDALPQTQTHQEATRRFRARIQEAAHQETMTRSIIQSQPIMQSHQLMQFQPPAGAALRSHQERLTMIVPPTTTAIQSQQPQHPMRWLQQGVIRIQSMSQEPVNFQHPPQAMQYQPVLHVIQSPQQMMQSQTPGIQSQTVELQRQQEVMQSQESQATISNNSNHQHPLLTHTSFLQAQTTRPSQGPQATIYYNNAAGTATNNHQTPQLQQLLHSSQTLQSPPTIQFYRMQLEAAQQNSSHPSVGVVSSSLPMQQHSNRPPIHRHYHPTLSQHQEHHISGDQTMHFPNINPPTMNRNVVVNNAPAPLNDDQMSLPHHYHRH